MYVQAAICFHKVVRNSRIFTFIYLLFFPHFMLLSLFIYLFTLFTEAKRLVEIMVDTQQVL